MFAKLGKWFLSEAGKTAMYFTAGATSVSLLSINVFPNLFFLDKYEDVVHLYKFGIKVKLSEKVRDRFNRALDMLEISDFDRKLIKPFTVFGFDMFNAGMLQSKYGGILGIPSNFSFLDEESIEASEIMVLNEPVQWSTESGKELLDALILSENAQIFAIAREVLYLDSLKFIFDSVYAPFACVFTYGLARTLNTKYNLYVKPLSLRLLMYTLSGLFGYGLYSFAKDMTQMGYDQKVDEELCKRGPLFVEGGKEFYEKTLQRNRALRTLMGPLGEKYYSVLGNERFFIRQPRLPILTRKDFYENKLKALVV